jgi:hypothetical protein
MKRIFRTSRPRRSPRRVAASISLLACVAGLPWAAAACGSSEGSRDAGAEALPATGSTTIPDVHGRAKPLAAQEGLWSEPLPWPVIPVHMLVLPDGTVLTWGHNGPRQLPGWTDFVAWDPASGAWSTFREGTTSLFCAGHTLLPDGRLLIVGGHEAEHVGTRNVTLFDPSARSFSAAGTMNAGRWYPSVTLLENGDALILGGEVVRDSTNGLAQVWSADGGLRDLPGVEWEPPNYAGGFLAPDGEAFFAGPGRMSRSVSSAGAGHVRDVALHVEKPTRYYGAAVMYDDARILVVGGGDPPTATAEVIDLSDPEPRWRLTGSMVRGRRQLNATLLADGTVLVTGGTSAPGHSDPAGAVLDAEIWDPETERWTVVAGMPEHRLYHSAAALLPDGRVLSGGGDAERIEIYWPPYLFAADGAPAARPGITAAPGRLRYGESFRVATPDAGEIARAHLIRLSAATHARNLQQRLVRLPMAASLEAGNPVGLRLTAPSGPRSAPPGHYLLFLVDREGVPSMGRVVRVG